MRHGRIQFVGEANPLVEICFEHLRTIGQQFAAGRTLVAGLSRTDRRTPLASCPPDTLSVNGVLSHCIRHT